MTRTIIFCIAVIMFFGVTVPSISSSDEGKDLANPYVMDYPFNSAVIHYSGKRESGYHGKDQSAKGNETVYIKDDRLAKIVEMNITTADGNIKKQKNLRIITPEYIYMIDLVDKSGIKMDNPKKYGKEAYEELTKKQKEAFHNRMEMRNIVSLDLLGIGKKTGTEEILGRKCDIYESGEKLSKMERMEAIQARQNPVYTKSWIWREARVPLRVITEEFASRSELNATKIDLNVDIPESRFEVPSDIKIEFDEKRSEMSKKATLARFNLYKTGESMVVKYDVEKTPAKPEERPENNDEINEQDSDEEQQKSDKGRVLDFLGTTLF